MAKAIMPSELQERLRRGERLRLIDVRTPAEFRSGYLHGATNVPLDRIDYRRWVDDRRTDPRPIVLLCERGSRAAQAGEALSKAGRDDAIVVEGGTRACDEAGLTIVRGRRAISMERQDRSRFAGARRNRPLVDRLYDRARALGLRRRRTRLCRSLEYLRHGPGPGSDALESLSGSRMRTRSDADRRANLPARGFRSVESLSVVGTLKCIDRLVSVTRW